MYIYSTYTYIYKVPYIRTYVHTYIHIYIYTCNFLAFRCIQIIREHHKQTSTQSICSLPVYVADMPIVNRHIPSIFKFNSIHMSPISRERFVQLHSKIHNDFFSNATVNLSICHRYVSLGMTIMWALMCFQSWFQSWGIYQQHVTKKWENPWKITSWIHFGWCSDAIFWGLKSAWLILTIILTHYTICRSI